MLELRSKIFQKLISNENITNNVSEYLGYPSIFTVEPIPTDVELPYVIVNQVSEVPNETKTQDGRNVLIDIRIYANEDGNISLIENLVEEIYQMFHNQEISTNNFENYLLRVVEILNANEEKVYGRIVSIRALFSKKNN